jgi:hypothetical protein
MAALLSSTTMKASGVAVAGYKAETVAVLGAGAVEEADF